MDNIQDKLARACKSLILREPFYGLFLIGLNKKIRKDVPTAGISKNGIGIQLSINPDFFMKFWQYKVRNETPVSLPQYDCVLK